MQGQLNNKLRGMKMLIIPYNLDRVNPNNKKLLTEFLQHLTLSGHEDITIKEYDYVMSVFFAWNLLYNSNKIFNEILKKDLTEFLSFIRIVFGINESVVNKMIVKIKVFEKWFYVTYGKELSRYKPKFVNYKVEKVVRKRTETKLNDRLVKRLLDYFVERERYEEACFLALAVYSGRRRSELLRFKVHYFDEENLICNGGLYKTPEKIALGEQDDCVKKAYMYVLAPDFKPYLDMHLKEREKKGFQSEWLFSDTHSDGSTHLSKQFSNRVKREIGSYINMKFDWQLAKVYFNERLLDYGLPIEAIRIIAGTNYKYIKDYNVEENDEFLGNYFTSEGILLTQGLKKV